MQKFHVFLTLVLVVLLTACNLPSAPSPTPETPILLPTHSLPVPTETPPLPPTQTPTPTTPPLPDLPLTIAFLQDGDAYIWREGGMNIRLTATGDVGSILVAPDGETVLFTRGDPENQDMWAIQADGSDMRLLFSTVQFDALVPGQQNYLSAWPFPPGAAAYDFIPGTSRIAFISTYLVEGPGVPSNRDVQTLDYVNGAHSTLLAPGSGAGALDFSPDGQWVALVDGDRIDLMRADGSARRTLLTFPFVYTYSEWMYYPRLVWLGDSSAFRVIIPAQDPLGDPAAPSRIYQVATDGSVLETGQFVGAPIFISPPSLAADGNFFAYLVENVPGSGSYDLHLATHDLTFDNLAYTGSQMSFIGWSLDSSAYLFWSEGLTQLNLGKPRSLPYAFLSSDALRAVNWVSSDRFLAAYGTGSSRALRLYALDGSFVTLSGTAEDVSTYDFAPRP